MISFNSSLLNSVEIKTSWAVLPFLAIALYPFIVFTDNLIINLEDLPLALEITAGVIVLILISSANFWSIGIKPSIFVLWFKTSLPNFNLSLFYLENFVSEKLTLALKWLKILKICYIYISDLNLMIFQIGWAALAAIFTFSIAMVVWGRNGDGSIDIWFHF